MCILLVLPMDIPLLLLLALGSLVAGMDSLLLVAGMGRLLLVEDMLLVGCMLVAVGRDTGRCMLAVESYKDLGKVLVVGMNLQAVWMDLGSRIGLLLARCSRLVGCNLLLVVRGSWLLVGQGRLLLVEQDRMLLVANILLLECIPLAEDIENCILPRLVVGNQVVEKDRYTRLDRLLVGNWKAGKGMRSQQQAVGKIPAFGDIALRCILQPLVVGRQMEQHRIAVDLGRSLVVRRVADILLVGRVEWQGFVGIGLLLGLCPNHVMLCIGLGLWR